MHELLRENPLILLFSVAAAGYLLGKVRVFGATLGVAAVLFAGLAASAIDPELRLPEIVHQLGLVLFVYTLGVSSGPGFFASFRRRGLRDNGLAFFALLSAAGATALLAHLAGLTPGSTAGLYAGAITNTPALAAVVQSLHGVPGGAADAAVVAYSVAYPLGVLGVITVLAIGRRVAAREPGGIERVAKATLENATVRVTRAEAAGRPAGELCLAAGGTFLFGRMKRGQLVSIVDATTTFAVGDLVSIVGIASGVQKATEFLGELTTDRLDLDRTVVDYRRMFVSNPEVTGKPLADLRLPQRFGAVVTRLRRGEVELLPDGSTILELGDRVRVVATRARLDEVSRFFGDSFRALAEVDVITFGLGAALGLLVGSVALPLPGGGAFRLGFAGGPLVVGLVLGRLHRTGPLVWTLPSSAGLTLRQLGLVLFLAGIGTRSGDAFVRTLASGHGTGLLFLGALVTVFTTTLVLLVGRRLLKIPFDTVAGIACGLHTQPAALAFATEQAGDDRPNTGYAAVYPLATITKIVLAQLLLSW